MTRVTHEFGPVYDRHSKILILGSIPSVRSRQTGFYYGHPQNRFWKVLTTVFGEHKIPVSIEEKKELCLRHHIALWDVLESCDIEGSSDASIRDPKPIDINLILKNCKLEKIYTNGATAHRYYDKFLKDITKMEAVKLASTSPANAAFDMDRLVKEWRCLKKNIEI